MLAAYFGLTYFGGEMGRKILYPIRLLVTFLHEFGHAVGAILTGGWVENVQINQDGSGWTRSANGNRAITIMGGYLGSAIFGNILFFIGAKLKWFVKPTLTLLALSMVFTGFYWHTSAFTTGMLMLFALVLLLITYKTSLGKAVLMFIGLASILFIIQDFNVGPSSDLAAYAEELVILPAVAWKYIWLFIVVVMSLFNLKMLLKSEKKEVSDFDLKKADWDM
ncbi:MAG: hypothetical protein HKN51_14635 [Saprospiraceae bacterium]|nr:hypothetical protein [Saprospiraceae bacterium]